MLKEMQIKVWNQIYNEKLLKKHRNLIEPNIFTIPPLIRLTEILLLSWDKYSKLPSKEYMYTILEKSVETFPQNAVLLPVFKEILDSTADDDSGTTEILLNILQERAYEKLQAKISERISHKEYDSILLDVLKTEEYLEKDESQYVYKFSDFPLEELKKLLIREYTTLPKLPTGIEELDSHLHGGIARGKVSTLLAPTSFGKTTFLTLFGHHARKMGFFVLHFTIEETKLDTLLKYASIAIGRRFEANLHDLDTLTNTNDSTRMESVRHTEGWVVEKSNLTLADMVVMIQKIKALYQPQNILVILDYADLIQISDKTKKFEAERFRSTEIFQTLNHIAKGENVWLWTACQATRKAAFKNLIQVEDIAEDYNKARLSSYVVSICCNLEEERKNIRRLFIAKNRFGKRYATASIKINWETFVLSSLTEAEKEEVRPVETNYEKLPNLTKNHN